LGRILSAVVVLNTRKELKREIRKEVNLSDSF